MKAQKLHRSKVLAKIEEANNRPYQVTFVKKDHTVRKMNAQQGIEHDLKGGKNNVIRTDNAYITTFDTDKNAYRTINLSTVLALTVNGIPYEVVL